MIYKGTLLAINNPSKLIVFLGDHTKKEVYPLAKKAVGRITNILKKKSKFYYVKKIEIIFDNGSCPFVDVHLPVLEVQPAIGYIMSKNNVNLYNFFGHILILNQNRCYGHFNYLDQYIHLRVFNFYKNFGILKRRPICKKHFMGKEDLLLNLLVLQRYFGYQYWFIINLISTFFPPYSETFDCEIVLFKT